MLLGCHLKYLTNNCYVSDKFASRVTKDVSQNRWQKNLKEFVCQTNRKETVKKQSVLLRLWVFGM